MNKQKLIGTFIGIILFIVAIAGLTYAYTIWTSEDMNKIVSSKCFDILYTKGQDITGPIMPSDTYLGGETSTFKLNIKSSCNINAKGKLYLNTSEDTSENLYTRGLLNYYVTKEDTFISSGNITSSGEIEIDLGLLETKDSATTNYTVYVWIDNNSVENTDAFSSYSGNIRVEVVQATQGSESTGINLLNHITNLYKNGNQELITQTTSNDSYYYSYQDDNKSWGLMNDGLKIDTSLDATTTGLATTVTSTEALTSGTEGNIRYYGPSDKVNNYIYFNCSDYSNQTDSTCEKWRIIGIVDGKVKLIRNESIGDLAWDQDKNQVSSLTTYNNNWTNSSLQEFLNGLYYNRGTIESHPYYSGSDGSTTTTLNLKTIGITEATRNNNLISESTWYLGGYKDSKLYPNQIYTYERTNKVGTTIYSTNPFTLENTKIGLMYSSDYGYATNLKECSKDIYNYDTLTACKTNNWLFNSSNQWLITPFSSASPHAWRVLSSGYVHSRYSASNAYGVRPVLYLDSELTIESEGDGSSANPYRISVS